VLCRTTTVISRARRQRIPQSVDTGIIRILRRLVDLSRGLFSE
jgi:hypothetical protein